MRNITLGVALWLLSFVAAMAQKPAYFNTRKSLGYLATVFTGVYPTDSCLYLKGEMVDSLFRSGSFFSKMDLEGNPIWTTELIGTGKNYDFWDANILVNLAGNFIITGSLLDPEMAAFVVEIDPNGKIVRYRQYRNPFYPTEQFIVSRSLCVLKGGGYAISGVLLGVSAQKQNVFLFKLSDTLSLEWYKLLGTTGLSKTGYVVTSDEANNLTLGGMEYGNLGLKNIICRKEITRLDSTGEVLWDWKDPAQPDLPPVRGWQVNDMITLPDGSIVGASAVSRERLAANGKDAALDKYPSFFKMNPDRTLAWETRFGNGKWGEINQDMIRILPASDGGGYVGTATIGILGTAAAPYKEISVICKVSDTSDSLWMRPLYFWSDSLDNYYHKTEDMAAAPGGGYWLCGQVERQLPGEETQQGWLLRVDNYGCLSPGCQLVSASESPVEDKISIYPNPAFNYIVVHHGGHTFQKGHFSILNQQGQVVRDWVAPMDDVSTVFDVSRFPAGTYVLQYQEAGGLMAVKSFVVQR